MKVDVRTVPQPDPTAARISIGEMLDSGLPEKYTVDLFEQKCGAFLQHLLEKFPQWDAGV